MTLIAIYMFTYWAIQARTLYGPKTSWQPYTVLAWTDQSVNLHITCFICYIIPNLWIQETVIVLIDQDSIVLTDTCKIITSKRICLRDQFLYESKSWLSCRKMCVVTIYLCRTNINIVFVIILKQSIQSCTPLVNKQLAPGFHSDSITGWRHTGTRTNYSNEVYYLEIYLFRRSVGLHVEYSVNDATYRSQ